jgi:hypothetical protein
LIFYKFAELIILHINFYMILIMLK